MKNQFSLVLASYLACACEAPSRQSSTIDVTHVDHSPVKRQAIGNCWLYAQASWLESIYKSTYSQEINVSETYWTYWDLFEKLLAHRESVAEGINTGGTWKLSSHIIQTYGWVDEASFVPYEAGTPMSDTQSCAESYLTQAIQPGGSLDPSIVRSPELIRTELDKAFSCKGLYQIDIAEAYRNRHLAAETLLKDPKTGLETTLAQVLLAWKEFPNPAFSGWNALEGKKLPNATANQAYRALETRIMKALNDHQPVVLAFFVSFNAPNGDGFFNLNTLAEKNALGKTGGHMVVLHDYTVTDVPELGSIGEGEVDDDTKALALTGHLDYLVVKNSWGFDRVDRPWLGNGYSRITWDYLTQTYYDEESQIFRPFLWGVAFPPGY